MEEIIVGTYEGFLLGYKQCVEDNRLKQTFATQSHTSSVRCLSINNDYLASGGTDDKIVVINLKTRKEHTVLMHHDGTVNTLSFTNSGTHLISGSDDGTLVMTRVGNWQIEKKWKKAHNALAVNSVAVHPSDKLALSIGNDNTLKTWNLIKGRIAFTINLNSKGVSLATELRFSPDSDRFSFHHQQTVDVWSLSKAGLEKRFKLQCKPSSVQWIDDNRIVVGIENGNIVNMNLADDKAVTYGSHKDRVKCLHYDDGTLYSASSTGEIKVWALTDVSVTEQVLAAADCRITCMTLNKHK